MTTKRKIPEAAAAEIADPKAKAAERAVTVEKRLKTNPGLYGDIVDLKSIQTSKSTTKETKDKFNEAIKALKENEELHVYKNKDYDFFITLREHYHSVHAHHIHFYINDNRCVWHYSYHAGEDKRQPQNGAYLYVYAPENFSRLLLTLLEFEFEGIQTLRQRFDDVVPHDPFAFLQDGRKKSSKFGKESKKGQQKKSSRKKSCRKKSCRKKSCRKKSCRKKVL
jgi:hypothetical protein